jgi:threonine aldolase
MISFTNDYSEGAHPKILELLTRTHLEQNNGYGNDIHCDRAIQYMKKHIKREDVDIHFLAGGTQTNLLVISAFLRPHQCVIAADSGHINVHETGAIEATGHKVFTVPGRDGKLTPAAIMKALEYHTDEHMVKPGMVYLSDSTELGTIYTKRELEAISTLCKEKNLILFLDGARLGSALTCKKNDMTLEDIAALTDVFYIGGTKNGALLGEALVLCKEELKEDFRYLMKQRGAMLAKGFVIGIQFEALFEDRLYFDLGSHANRMAEQIAKALADLGYEFYTPVCSNQLFPILPDTLIEQLSTEFDFLVQERLEGGNSVIRLVTSWATPQQSVDTLIRFLKEARA